MNDYTKLVKYAEILKTIAHPVRLSIVRDLMRNTEKIVSELDTGSDIIMPRVSQHLKTMRYAGLLKVRKEGTKRYYSLVKDDPINNYVFQSLVNNAFKNLLFNEIR